MHLAEVRLWGRTIGAVTKEADAELKRVVDRHNKTIYTLQMVTAERDRLKYELSVLKNKPTTTQKIKRFIGLRG